MSLYRREGSPFWWSKLYAGRGSPHRFSTGARTKVAALAKEREEAGRLAKLYKAESVRSLATLAALFLENVEANSRSDATLKAHKKYMERLIIPFFGAERDVSSITTQDFEGFKASRMKEVQPQTVSKELSTLRQMMRFGGEILKLYPSSEIPSTRSPKLPRYTPKWRLLTEDELGRLLTALKQHERRNREAIPFFLLLMNTGMRSGEPAQLHREWINLETREIHLPAEVTKTRTARIVPINDSALLALMMVIKPNAIGRVFRYKTHYAVWHRAVHAAGLARFPNRGTMNRPTSSGVRPHDLRHSYGSLLYLSGTSIPEVRDILGHATLMMANLYAHTFNERLHKAVNATQIAIPTEQPKKAVDTARRSTTRSQVRRSR